MPSPTMPAEQEKDPGDGRQTADSQQCRIVDKDKWYQEKEQRKARFNPASQSPVLAIPAAA